MRPLSSTELPPLVFNKGVSSQKCKASTGKICWLHSLSDKAGGKFDVVVKDALGRKKFEKQGCGGGTGEYGEIVNIPTLIGEDLEIEVNNIQGAEEIKLFLN